VSRRQQGRWFKTAGAAIQVPSFRGFPCRRLGDLHPVILIIRIPASPTFSLRYRALLGIPRFDITNHLRSPLLLLSDIGRKRIVQLMKRTALESLPGDLYQELIQVAEIADRHFWHQIEFKVQNGRLFIGAPRERSDLSPLARIRIMLHLLLGGTLSPEDLLARIQLDDVEALLQPEITDKACLRWLTTGAPVNRGAASGRIAFSTRSVGSFKLANEPAILVAESLSLRDPAVARAAGVLISHRERHFHSGRICEMLRLPAVGAIFDFQNLPRGKRALLFEGLAPLKEGDWLTIEGMTGGVFAGRAKVRTKPWRTHPELQQLWLIIEQAVYSGHVPPRRAGAVWQIWDLLRHGVRLANTQRRGGVAHNQSTGSFLPPLQDADAIRGTMFQWESTSALVQRLCAASRNGLSQTIGMMEKNDTAMILGLVTAIERQIREVLGLESSHLYCHPLWQPMIETRSTGDAQLVGFELFGIDRYIRQLNGISHIRLLLECELHSPDEEWHFEPSCDRQTFCGCDFQGLGREWHLGVFDFGCAVTDL